MENRAHALAAGVFAVLLTIAAVAAVWWFGGSRQATSDYLVVTQQNVSGLNVQGAVRYRGIRVGRITSIRLDPENVRNILIRISIERDVPVTRGTTAKLGYQGLTGIAHVLLEDSGRDPAPVSADKGLPRIPMQASLLQELSETGGSTLRQANALLTNLNDLFGPENKARIGRTLVNLEQGSAALTATLAEARAILADPRLKRLGPAIAKVETAAGSVQDTLDEARQLLPKLAAVSGKVERLLGEAGDGDVAGAGAGLRELSRELTLASRQLAHALQLFEDEPQRLLFGGAPAAPGPGEPGFVPPSAGRP